MQFLTIFKVNLMKYHTSQKSAYLYFAHTQRDCENMKEKIALEKLEKQLCYYKTTLRYSLSFIRKQSVFKLGRCQSTVYKYFLIS